MIKYLYTFFILFVASLGLSQAQEMKSGVLDLSDYPLETETAAVIGEMDFYLDAHYSLQDIKQQKPVSQLIYSGKSWNNQPEAYQNNPSFGYGTYHCKVYIPSHIVGQTLLIRPKHFISYASKVFVNGKLCAYNGGIGQGEDDPNYFPSREINVLSFVPDTTSLDVVVWVSNYHHYRGGVFRPLMLGLEQEMTTIRERSLAMDLVIVVSLFVLFLYHLLLFLFGNRDKVILYYAIACLVFSLDLTFRGSMSYFQIFEGTHFAFYSALHLILPCFIAMFFVVFVWSLYPEDVPRWLLKVSIIVGTSFTLLTAFGGPLLQGALIKTHGYYAGALTIYFYIVIFKIIKNKRYGAYMFTIAYLVFSLCAFNDILYMFEVVHTVYLLTYGIVVFVFLLSILYGRKTSYLFEQNRVMSNELKALNISLESKVEERTKALDQSLQDMKKRMGFQEAMTHLIAHDLKSPLMQIVNIDIYRKKDFPSIKNSGYRMLNMIENMLDLYRYNNQHVRLTKSLFKLLPAVNEVVNEFTFYAQKKSLQFEIIADNELKINSDIRVFKRVMNNLLSNAIRYSTVEETITIQLTANDANELKVSVTNQGPGLDDEQKQSIFGAKGLFNAAPKNRRSGVGLHLSQLAIEHLGGNIGVNSDGFSTVTFWFTLPEVKGVESQTTDVLINFNEHINLSGKDREYLLPFAEKLKNYDVFETSQIDEVIKKIDHKTEKVTSWVNALEKVCYVLDDKKYKELISFVLQ